MQKQTNSLYLSLSLFRHAWEFLGDSVLFAVSPLTHYKHGSASTSVSAVWRAQPIVAIEPLRLLSRSSSSLVTLLHKLTWLVFDADLAFRCHKTDQFNARRSL